MSHEQPVPDELHLVELANPVPPGSPQTELGRDLLVEILGADPPGIDRVSPFRLVVPAAAVATATALALVGLYALAASAS